MTVEEVLEYFGSGYKFEQMTKLSHSNLVLWRRQGYIPLRSQRMLEKFSAGTLQVRLEDLQPKGDAG